MKTTYNKNFNQYQTTSKNNQFATSGDTHIESITRMLSLIKYWNDVAKLSK